MDSLKAVLGDKHPEVVDRISQLEELQKQRPVGTRLLAAQRKISKMEKKLEQKQKSVAEVEKSIAESKQKLEELQGEAAALERSGKKVPETLRQSIEDVRRRVQENEESIVRRHKEKEELAAKFNADLARYRELRAKYPTWSRESL